jgi:uncharacterized protein (DUF305 family)
MNSYLRLALLALVLVTSLGLASCGSSSSGAGAQGNGSGGDMEGMNQGGSGNQATAEKTGGMAGMDHGNMGGMDQGSMASEEMARQMVAPNGEYSDVAFIDALVPHHEGAVEMAQVALKNAEHEEIKRLARDIVGAQRAEIEQLGKIRKESGAEGPPSEMSDMDMQIMGMTDPDELANQRPFDKAFIEAMIPHHESAIAMANVALEESTNPQIREIAGDIVNAQEREISQMKEWRQQWYPEG